MQSKNIFVNKLISCGIPTIDVSDYSFDIKYKSIIQSFVLGHANVAIIGTNSYEYSISLLRIKLAYDIGTNLYFNTHSGFSFIKTFQFMDFDTISLINIFSSIRFDLSGIIDNLIRNNKQVLLSSINMANFKEALANCWPTIDSNFEAIKL